MKSAQGRVRTALLTGGRAFVLSFASIVGSTVLFVLSVLSVVFVVLGLGLVTTPG